jgi:hypothetical protein
VASTALFTDTVDELLLQELPLLDRRFTWSTSGGAHSCAPRLRFHQCGLERSALQHHPALPAAPHL